MLKIGFVGWRGMVGSVLMERMLAEKDFEGYEPIFFTSTFLPRSTSWSPVRAAITLRRFTPNCAR